MNPAQTTPHLDPALPARETEVPFLRKNQYALLYSLRCNYACSYCCTKAGRGSPQSWVEANPARVARFLLALEPGVVMISGGEPFLWRELPALARITSRHIWIVLTNASLVPRNLQPDLFPMVIAAYHSEAADWNRFLNNVLEYQQRGVRVLVKLIVKPFQEQETLDQWKAAWDQGISAHLCPLEYNVHFPLRRLQEIVDHHLTSCLYNSRFFRLPLRRGYCPAGSREMLEINPDGTVVACSTVMRPVGHAGREVPTTPGIACPADNCYCEWHHWKGVASNHENPRWNYFFQTGTWIHPSREEFRDYLIKAGYSLHGMNLEQSREAWV
ncbi:MAG: radical SAM protein [bacterium]